jgi:two-component system sensor histidine kinase KdpD
MTTAIQRGRLKIFLGYAAGVGKTFQMLTEAHELKARGVDVVIGYFEPHERKETIALAEGLDTIPRAWSSTAEPSSRRWIPRR